MCDEVPPRWMGVWCDVVWYGGYQVVWCGGRSWSPGRVCVRRIRAQRAKRDGPSERARSIHQGLAVPGGWQAGVGRGGFVREPISFPSRWMGAWAGAAPPLRRLDRYLGCVDGWLSWDLCPAMISCGLVWSAPWAVLVDLGRCDEPASDAAGRCRPVLAHQIRPPLWPRSACAESMVPLVCRRSSVVSLEPRCRLVISVPGPVALPPDVGSTPLFSSLSKPDMDHLVGLLLGALDQVLPWRVLLGLALACIVSVSKERSTGRKGVNIPQSSSALYSKCVTFG